MSDTMANMAATSWANRLQYGQLANMVTQGEAELRTDWPQSIIKDILRIALQVKLVNPAAAAGHGTLCPLLAKPPAARSMRGKTYLVGEKGPELFTASNTGNIVPNNQAWQQHPGQHLHPARRNRRNPHPAGRKRRHH